MRPARGQLRGVRIADRRDGPAGYRAHALATASALGEVRPSIEPLMTICRYMITYCVRLGEPERWGSSWTERGTRCSTPGPEGPPGPVTHPAAGLTRRPECSDDERLAGGLGRTAYAAAHSRTDVFHDHEDFCII